MRPRCVVLLSISIGALVASAVPAQAQFILSGGIWDIAPAAGARSPGRMVADGLARAEGLAINPLATPVITELPTPSIRHQVLPQVIESFFNELNTGLVAFINLLFAREGEGPFIPPSLSSNLSSFNGAVSDFLKASSPH